jgi:hypothetical protein
MVRVAARSHPSGRRIPDQRVILIGEMVISVLSVS